MRMTTTMYITIMTADWEWFAIIIPNLVLQINKFRSFKPKFNKEKRRED